MEEILPGVWHWTAHNDTIGQDVSSYYLEDAGATLDPLLPAEGVGAFGDWAVQQVILTNRLHGRDTEPVVEHFGARVRVRVPEAGKSHFQGRAYAVETYAPGDEIAAGVRSLELAAISPDDGVLHIHAGLGALHFADGLLSHGGELALMPDELMDDPGSVKATTLERLRALVEAEDFDALLFAHGDPITSGGRDQLAAFVSRSRA